MYLIENSKKIIIVRHAKSSWETQVTDHKRPLIERGINDAHLVSSSLNNQVNPDHILSSDANRAKSTAHIFMGNLNRSINDICFNPDLYDFSGENLVKVVKSCDDIHNEIMVFGHNHALTFFVNKYGNKHIFNVPTSGVVIIEFDINHWNDLKQGKTIKTIFPKDLK